MTDDDKPRRTLELVVDIAAPPEAVWKALTEASGISNWFPPEASTQGIGVGSTVTFAFSPEMTWSIHVSAWEPGQRVCWSSNDMFGPGTRLLCDFFITAEGGTTRVRMVQSGFGDMAWDDFFEGTENGWSVFFHILRVYLEKHVGKNRRVISTRFPSALPREAAWEKLISPAAGLLARGVPAVGNVVDVRLHDVTASGVVEIAKAGHTLAVRIPELDDSLLHVELETGTPNFHTGIYLSVWDPETGQRIDTPARTALANLSTALSTQA
jgi:uncharacterized protein YndB with AHSA1/START domain